MEGSSRAAEGRALRRRGNQRLRHFDEVPGANARPMRRCVVEYVTGLRCRECARPYPAEALHVCDYCFGPLEVVYDYDALRATVTREQIAAGPQTIWRYADLIPVPDHTPFHLGPG